MTCCAWSSLRVWNSLGKCLVEHPVLASTGFSAVADGYSIVNKQLPNTESEPWKSHQVPCWFSRKNPQNSYISRDLAWLENQETRLGAKPTSVYWHLLDYYGFFTGCVSPSSEMCTCQIVPPRCPPPKPDTTSESAKMLNLRGSDSDFGFSLIHRSRFRPDAAGLQAMKHEKPTASARSISASSLSLRTTSISSSSLSLRTRCSFGILNFLCIARLDMVSVDVMTLWLRKPKASYLVCPFQHLHVTAVCLCIFHLLKLLSTRPCILISASFINILTDFTLMRRPTDLCISHVVILFQILDVTSFDLTKVLTPRRFQSSIEELYALDTDSIWQILSVWPPSDHPESSSRSENFDP